ncbi:MAG: hypothetical protein PHP50_14225 [Lachnospiraceae bacterium]|nr:hypothetical protein [Lachnospiraceae bacterium]
MKMVTGFDEFISLIPVGRINAVSRRYLSSITHMSDRKVREMIELVNASGKSLIVNLSDGNGYFIPAEDEKHLARLYKAQEARRFNSLKDKLTGMNYYMDKNNPKPVSDLEKNQISIFDLMESNSV